MKLQCNQDQLQASQKPTARPHVEWNVELVSSWWVIDVGSLSVASTDTRSNSTQKGRWRQRRSQQWRQVERYIQERPKQWAISIIYYYNSMKPPRRRQQQHQQARATADTRNHSPPSIHSSPRHHHRDALVLLHPQFSQICPRDYAITAIHSCRSHHQ